MNTAAHSVEKTREVTEKIRENPPVFARVFEKAFVRAANIKTPDEQPTGGIEIALLYPKLAEVIQEEFGVNVHPNTVKNLMKADLIPLETVGQGPRRTKMVKLDTTMIRDFYNFAAEGAEVVAPTTPAMSISGQQKFDEAVETFVRDVHEQMKIAGGALSKVNNAFNQLKNILQENKELKKENEKLEQETFDLRAELKTVRSELDKARTSATTSAAPQSEAPVATPPATANTTAVAPSTPTTGENQKENTTK